MSEDARSQEQTPEGAKLHKVSRKWFIDWVLGAGAGALGASVLYPVTRYLLPPPAGESTTNSVTAPFKAGDLPRNAGRVINFGGKPALVLRTPSGELRAFTAICTHLGCTVQYREDLTQIWCACHNGHYDLNGRNIAGPPPAPLAPYDVNVRGDQIVVSKKA